MHTSTAKVAAIVAGLLVLASTSSLASIENEPVKVTHKNSGPKYDVSMEVEKTLLGADNDQSINQVLPVRPVMSQEPTGSGENNDNDSPIGHLSIRRIFLVPMRPSFSSREDMPAPQQQPSPDSMEPRLSANLWPIFGLAPQSQSRHHLFGQDEASRPPMNAHEEPIASSPSAMAEREQHQPQGALLDPIQMLMDMMQQATAHLGNTFLTDLNREATSSNNGSKPADSNQDSSLEKPQIPMGRHNETKEEIVEIEGRKYLRKVVINRHVGDNLIFMTKRLIFVPLNETETATTTTTEIPAASDNGGVERETEPVNRKPDQEPASSTTTTTTTTTTSTTTAAPEEAKSEATSTAAEQTTTTTASTQEASSPSSAPSTTPLDKDKEAASTLDVIRRAVNNNSS